MFCKWCGAQTGPAEQVCSRCGRKIPALSNCGGFYDLVPGAPRAEEPREKPKQKAEPEPSPSAPKKKGGNAQAAVLCAVGGMFVALVLIQSMMLVQISKLNHAVYQISENMEQSQTARTEPDVADSPEVTDSPEDPEPTENRGATEPPEDPEPTENREDTDAPEDREPTQSGEATDPPDVTESTGAPEPTDPGMEGSAEEPDKPGSLWPYYEE